MNDAVKRGNEKKFGENGNNLKVQILEEIEAMARYALQHGLSIPPDTVDLVARNSDPAKQGTPGDLRKLTLLHYKLAKTVSPALPSAILLLHNEKKKKSPLLFLGGVSLVRRIMFIALFFLVTFMALCTLPFVNEESIKQGILNSDFTVVLLNLSLIVTSAGLGASFAALFKANWYIVRGQFDPKYDSSYWIRLILGMMAGLVLATVVPIDLNKVANRMGSGTEHIFQTDLAVFSKLILAMLGGFSSTLFYKILKRFVETIESLISGSPARIIAGKDEIQKAKMGEESAFLLLNINTKLSRLQSRITADLPADQVKSEIAAIMSDLIPAEATTELTPESQNSTSGGEEEEKKEENENEDGYNTGEDGEEDGENDPGKIDRSS